MGERWQIRAWEAALAGLPRVVAAVAPVRARRRRLLCWVGLVVVAGLVLARQADATSLSPSDAFYWALPALPGNPYNQEGAIATSPDGNFVYVADKYANALEEYTSDGALKRLLRFRVPTAPTGITTDLSGNVYVVYEARGVVAKFTANLKLLSSWSVPFAKSIAADRAGHVWVLTNFLNAVGEYDSNGKSIGGFDATFPGQYFSSSGYDPPDKTVAREIAVDGAGRPIVVGESDQPLSDPEPDCHSVIDAPYPYGVDHHPYFDPLVSGEAVRFTSAGAAVDYGWLSESNVDCYHGWVSDGYSPGGVAVDPNSGGVYATTDTQLAVLRLTPGLDNPNAYGGQPPSTEGNLPLPCFSCSTSEEFRIAGNPPLSVAVDCRSDLYVLTNANARAVVKYINQDYVPPSRCSPLLQRASASPGMTLFPKFAVNGGGKASVLIGCHVKLCVGAVSLGINSSLCPHCIISLPRRFRIQPGEDETLSVRLNKLGRKLLAQHPGVAIKVVGKLKHGHTTTESEQLRQPATLTEACRMPGAPGGDAAVSGFLRPAHAHDAIVVDYVPSAASGVLLPAVQRTVFTNASGQFSDRSRLGTATKWTVLVNWGGDTTHQPAHARPCAGTVPKTATHLTLTCPTAASVGTPSPFTGTLTGAPADARLVVLYGPLSAAVTAHSVAVDGGGEFTDSFAPNQSGAWEAIVHYNGDANHLASLAVCQFTVASPLQNDFSISVTPASASIAPGQSVTATVTTAVISGAAQTVSFTTSGANPGAVSVAPPSVTAGGSTTLNVQSLPTTAPGAYVITITGTGSVATHSTSYTLNVKAGLLSLSCTAGPGHNVISCTGQLTSGGSAITGAPITITYQPPAPGSATVHTATTNAAGTFSDSLGGAAGGRRWPPARGASRPNTRATARTPRPPAPRP